MESRALICTVFVVALVYSTVHAAALHAHPQEVRSGAFSMGMDDLKEWVQSHSPLAENGWSHGGEEKQWYQNIARVVEDSFSDSIDTDREEERANGRILVASVDYEGDYAAGANNNPLTSPPPVTPPGYRKRRLLQDYSPEANTINSYRHQRRRKLLHYEPAANPIIMH